MSPSIFDFVKSEEGRFDTKQVKVLDNWDWNFRTHTNMSLSFKYGQFTTGGNDWTRPFRKVIAPILKLRYRSQDIEVKDIVLYAEEENGRVLSFLIKKYHDDVFLKKYNLDSFIDEAKEGEIDLGGVLIQKTNTARPEVLPLIRVAFCDQTDIMGGPIAFKHNFSPSKLKKMSSMGWGEEKNGANISIDDLIALADEGREPAGRTGQSKNHTPGKNIEAYILRGDLPEHYLKDNDNMEDYSYQLHVIAYYTDKKGNKEGVTLYRKKENESRMKFYASYPIEGRALGEGGAENLFQEQIWTNFLEIHKTNLLESGAKNLLVTDDPSFATRNKIQDMSNNEISTIADGKTIRQIPTLAANGIQLFDRAINEWWQSAQKLGSANDAQFGKAEYAGMTFRGQNQLVQEGRSEHEYLRGKFAKFLEEIYRDWIIPDMIKAVLSGVKFLSSLTHDEMEWVADEVSKNWANRHRMEQVINGQIPDDYETLSQKYRDEFVKGGNKRMLEILKDEFRDVEIKININIAGKNKNLPILTDKLLSIFQFAFSNPVGFSEVMKMPGMSKTFNKILELSGISQVDFYGLTNSISKNIENQPIPQNETSVSEPTNALELNSLTK